MNSQATNQTRATLLSISSLFSKMAGILSSVFCAALVFQIGITGVWLIMGGLTLIIALMVTIGQRQNHVFTGNNL